MFKNTYSKEQVNDLIQNEILTIKNEFYEYINSLQQKNKLLEETIEQMKVEHESNLQDQIIIVKNNLQNTFDNDLENITDDFENIIDAKFINIINENEQIIESINTIKLQIHNNQINQQIIIGYENNLKIPFFVPENFAAKHNGDILQGLKSRFKCDDMNIYFMLDSLTHLSYIENFDLKKYFMINLIDKYDNIIRPSSSSEISSIDFNDKSLKIIKKYCDIAGIRITFNDSEYQNGIMISTLIDQISE